MGQLKRYRGHFFNWYDTITLEPLLPRYISTVDSGNLVGDLLVLRQGLLEIPTDPVLSKNFAEGLSDTLTLLSDVLMTTERIRKGSRPLSCQRLQPLKTGEPGCQARRLTPGYISRTLTTLHQKYWQHSVPIRMTKSGGGLLQ
jgi:hypothetical protein